ncbi:uncharacterized protein PFL1_02322 [Pseudozyma flocculosa PF-1]|uniref:uncharacterized protein n=1 Tax=Pseudozyma flocculosa PF-1 TaxID=1277687 RepID=UPI00045614AB|nr:uncharacterized protein PFL1_02322 [Pseudozyma flocculosa PF-1]EPQ30206.1 hypothetical protein PFL1_02322 [Pseudozyma flocculosa PF-1]
MPTGISMGSIVDLDTATLHIPDMVRTDEYGLRSSVPGKSIPPKTVIEIGKPLEHSKNGSGKFTLKRFEAGFYVCSCPAWLYNQERDKFRRSCPHLSEVLGDEYEEERVRVAKDAPSSVWEDKGITRRASGSTVASRMARARSMLDEQLQEASQKDQGASKDCDGGVSKAVDNADKAPADKASETTSAEDAAASGVAASASSNSKRPAPVGQQDDSETEDEWELVKPVAQAPGPSNAAARTPEAPEAAAGVGKAFSFPWEQPSPSKKGRNGKADKNDDKVKLLLGHSWVLNADPKKPKSKPMDPSGWWVSEKLDGVRAFWDGQRLFSRQNLEWNAPTWWKDQLPKDLALDGELWMRRGEFDLTSQICRTTRSSEWHNIKYMVFDAPSMDGKVVEDRWAELKKRFGSTEGIDIDQLQGAVIRLVHHEKCVDRDHLVALLEEVNGKGGEGLMLRRPGSFYEFKRSRTMYKLKSFYDAEAKVVDYVEGEGRNEGRVGALVVEMENGLRTRIGSGLNDRQRENPPPVGTIVSYRFQEITQTGHPRFPSFRGVAHDKTRAKDAIVRPSSIVKVPDDT